MVQMAHNIVKSMTYKLCGSPGHCSAQLWIWRHNMCVYFKVDLLVPGRASLLPLRTSGTQLG